MNTQLKDTTNAYIQELKEQGYTDDLIQEALKAVMEAKAKAEAKAQKKAKAEPSPEQVRAQKLKKLKADLAKLEGVAVPSKDYSATKVKRTVGKADIKDTDIFAHALANGYKSVAIHKAKTKGSKTDLFWTVFSLDLINNLYKSADGKSFPSLTLAHKSFSTGTFSKTATLKSAYFFKTGEAHAKIPGRQLFTSADFLSTTPKKASPEGSVAPHEAHDHSDHEEEDSVCEMCGQAHADDQEECVFDE